MIDTEKFIKKIKTILIDAGLFDTIYSPDLPQEGENVCSLTLLGGSSVNSLSCGDLYFSPMFRCLIRGSEDDEETRQLTMQVYNALHRLHDVDFDGGKIIHIFANNLPVYGFRDENNRIYYNITFKSDVFLERNDDKRNQT